jgi:hypothetical protein
MNYKSLTNEQTREMINDYKSGLFMRELGRKYGVSNTTIKNYLKAAGVELRDARQEIKKSAHSRIGIKNPLYKNGKRTHKQGYIMVNVGANKYVLEHRLVMEREIGRKLLDSEVVHHINGIKDDNDPMNLFLFKNVSNHNIYHRKTEKGERIELKYEY